MAPENPPTAPTSLSVAVLAEVQAAIPCERAALTRRAEEVGNPGKQALAYIQREAPLKQTSCLSTFNTLAAIRKDSRQTFLDTIPMCEIFVEIRLFLMFLENTDT
ncbi:unnamed protein product [Arctogadus glacialis]